MDVEIDSEWKKQCFPQQFFFLQETTSVRTFNIYSRYATQCFHNPMLLCNALNIDEGGTWPLHYA